MISSVLGPVARKLETLGGHMEGLNNNIGTNNTKTHALEKQITSFLTTVKNNEALTRTLVEASKRSETPPPLRGLGRSVVGRRPDFYVDPEPEEGADVDDDESDEDPPEQPDDHPLADFEAFARRRPHDDFTRIIDLDGLGTRDLDRGYDWSPHVGRYDLSPDV
ncbi:uncharacterized protein Z518_02342 [Rhinocladiella mackenziei CBS 650.93]|uniref:Uncharacterized protein n=1 Tax=Rhinocladiella mackenziei CBS 650.93 TaxID=1442369 RepID=A0A0D2HB75_9EURO|nr:uncharacterized protein Z518_02342 [Rhinocladiella mackenziei CBS 650.93]KIX07688.1 hypothetical protein Z518_02342 [Rhinocladiella mackenziei CBS 650.93]